jgi:outer membrane protein
VKTLRLTAILTSLFLTQILFAQNADNGKWTLEKCVDYAFKHNFSIRQANLATGVSGNQLLQNKLNLLPSLNGSASYGFDFGNSINPVTYTFTNGNSQTSQIGLNGNLTLFNGLQQIYTIQKSKYDLLGSEFDYENAKSNMALNIASAYLQILLNREIVQVAEEQRKLTAGQKETVKKKYDAGAVPEQSFLEVDAQLSRDEANVVNNQGVYDISLVTLKQMLQLPMGQAFEVDVPNVNADNMSGITDMSSEGIFNYAVKNQPSVKSAEAKWMSAQVAQKVAKGFITPTLSLGYNLFSGYTNSPNETFQSTPPYIVNSPADPYFTQVKDNLKQIVSLQLSVPLFNKGQVFINISTTKLQQQIKELDYENSKAVLAGDIEQAYTNAKVAAQNYLANKRSYESAQKSFVSLQKRFDAGLVTNFDLQQSKNTLATAESDMIRAKYTYVFRVKILDYYQGKALTLN